LFSQKGWFPPDSFHRYFTVCNQTATERHRRAWPLDHVYNSLEYMNMINLEVFNFNLMLVLIMSIPQKMSVL
jgi:hypothetical protein